MVFALFIDFHDDDSPFVITASMCFTLVTFLHPFSESLEHQQSASENQK